MYGNIIHEPTKVKTRKNLMLYINIYILYIVKRHIESFVSKRFYVISLWGYLLWWILGLYTFASITSNEKPSMTTVRRMMAIIIIHFSCKLYSYFPLYSHFYLFIYIEIQNHTKNINSFFWCCIYFYRYIPNHECCCCLIRESCHGGNLL